MSPTDATLLEVVMAYQKTRPSAIATIYSILRTVAIPYWGVIIPPDTDFISTLASIPGHALYGLLEPDGTSWSASLARSLPPGNTYQRAYCRFLRRLVDHGERTGLLRPEQHTISLAWRDLIDELAKLPSDDSVTKRSAARCALRRLARWASTAAIEPADMPVLGPGFEVMGEFKATFRPERDGGFYQARRVWNQLVATRPAGPWKYWDATPTGSFTALPRAYWPRALERGIEQLFSREGLGSWRRETRQGYSYRLGSYLGILAHAGIAAHDLLNTVDDGTDALRVLFQGIPPGFSSQDPATFAARWVTDVDYRTSLLAAMRALSGSYDGRASDGNVLLVLAIATLVNAGKITSARNLAMKALAINKGLLELTERHTSWITRRVGLLEQLGRKNPTAYTRKKTAVFRQPTLWVKLVGTRPRLRAHSAALEAAWRAAGGSRQAYLKLRWAVAMRDEVIFGLMLCYPLRVNNLIGMQLGRNYRPDGYQLYFPPEETKNEREIDYELPEGGSLGDLRTLFDLYLAEARPALLAGRRSAHVFVPGPRGGLQLRAKAINAMLVDASRRFLADVLPEGVTTLNPHLLRHAAASYHVVIGRDLNLAAQMLNDSPLTISRSYSDVLASKKEATKHFLSGFQI